MGEMIMRNWDLREFRVRVNLPSPIQQVQVPIRRVITPIRGLPNLIRQVVPLISHICSYPPHRAHLHPPSLSFSSTTQQSSQNTKLSYPSPSLHAMIMSSHQVQHTLSTQDCLSSLHFHDYKLTTESSFSSRHASLHDRPPSASSPWELKGKFTLSHSHGCELTHWWIESQHPVRRRSTASQYSSKLARLWPPSSLDPRLQLYLRTRLITASTLPRSWPLSVFPNSLDYGLQSRSITASKCISKLAPLQRPQLHLQTPLITISECISMFTRSRPPSVSPSTLDYRLQVHLQSLDYSCGVYLEVHSIVIFRCTSNCCQAPPAANPDIPCVDR